MPELRFGVAYDFRNPPDSGQSDRLLYAEILEQVSWLDGLGCDLVWMTEHHFVDDGYLPSWVPVAGAMAAATERVRFGTDICLMPFNHPLRLAEDLAVLDNLSGGRVELGLGMGYAPHEFRGFGIPVSRRVSLMDEGIEVLQRAFSGERFSYHGRRYQFDDVVITPGYVQSGGPPLWIAAMSEAGARRAARFGTHLLPQGSRRSTLDTWAAALDASRGRTREHRVGIIRGMLVTHDRDTDWPAVRAAEKYRMALYQRFADESGEGIGHWDDAIPQTWIVGDPDHCVRELTDFVRVYGITDVVTMAVPPGLRPRDMNDSLERLFTEVAPRVKAVA